MGIQSSAVSGNEKFRRQADNPADTQAGFPQQDICEVLLEVPDREMDPAAAN